MREMDASGAAEPTTVFIVSVATTDGVTTHHGYPLLDTSREKASKVDPTLERIANVFEGRIPFLRLESPDVIYKPEHIVRVAFDLIRAEDMMKEVPGREPMGFRTPWKAAAGRRQRRYLTVRVTSRTRLARVSGCAHRHCDGSMRFPPEVGRRGKSIRPRQ